MPLPGNALIWAFGLYATIGEAANPGLVFSSAIDVRSRGEIDGIAVDSAGNSYLTGWTRAADILTTPGVVQPQFPGGSVDIFVVKLDGTGKVVFATYWGGPGDDEGLSIAVDPAGNVYVGGISVSNGTTTFPTTSGAAFRSGSPTGMDGFIVKLNSTGTAVVYSTLVPGAGQMGAAIAVDNLGNAYFAGTMQGSDNSITATTGAFQVSHGGSTDAIVAKFGPTGSLVYATFMGGSNTNSAGGIAVDSSGNAYVSGESDSMDFPVTAGAYSGPPASGESAFVVKLNAQGGALLYSTFLGPADPVGPLRLDSQGNAYVTGMSSPGFPVTVRAFQSSSAAPWNALYYSLLPFFAKLNSTGTDLIYSMLFASATRFDVDPAGNTYVAGVAGPGLPVTQGALQRCVAGTDTTMFVARLDTVGALAASSYLGGTAYDYPTGISAGSDGSVYLAETVSSADFPGLQNTVVEGPELTVSKLFISDPSKTDLPCLTAAIQNGASFANTPLAPGELVTLRGLDLGPATGATAQISSAGQVSNQLAGTQVFFNHMPAPLLYTQSEQINAQVPWELAGATTAQVQVQYQSSNSNTATVTIQDAAPAIFEIFPIPPAAANPPFQGAILNQDGTLNSPSNPAARGSVVSLFGTGGGTTAPGGITGGIAPLSPLGYLTLPVAVQIGPYQADVFYAGTAPTLISGVFQLNVRVPDAVAPGSVDVYLSIGGKGTSYPWFDEASLVTIAVK